MPISKTKHQPAEKAYTLPIHMETLTQHIIQYHHFDSQFYKRKNKQTQLDFSAI